MKMENTYYNRIFVAVFITAIFFSSCKNPAEGVQKQSKKNDMENKENRVSPAATASSTIAGNEVTVNYSSPRVKGRVIWGGLVPYDQVWRTGANEATTITFTKDVLIEGQPLKLGTYSLFTIPTANDWTIIFNFDDKQWGAFKYDQTEDALRVNVKPMAVDSFQENLTFYVLDDNTNSTGTVRLWWEKMQVDFHFKNAAEN